MGESLVVGVDLDHRQHRRERFVEGQQVAQLLLDEVADHALRLCAEDVERVRLDLLVRRALQSEQAYLRAVAVRDDQLVLERERGQRLGGDPDVGALVLGGHRLAAAEQRVAAQGYDDAHARKLSCRWWRPGRP